MNRIQFAIAQLRRTGGSRSSVDQLLRCRDLPGEGWAVLDERTWRTGVIRPRTGAADRARKAGSVTAWRSFEQTDPARWLWAQVIPYASAQDAAASIPVLRAGFVTNSHADVGVLSERAVEDYGVDGADASMLIEQATSSDRGPGEAKYVIASAGSAVFIVVCSGLEGRWSWDDVTSLAAAQGARIREQSRSVD